MHRWTKWEKEKKKPNHLTLSTILMCKQNNHYVAFAEKNQNEEIQCGSQIIAL